MAGPRSVRSRRRNSGEAVGHIDRAALRCRLDSGLAALEDRSHQRRVTDTPSGPRSGPESGLDPDNWIALDAAARERLIDFLFLLTHWNRVYNLTAVRDPLEMVPRHLLDSLVVLPWLTAGPVLDAGTGAGLPGLPLAIVRPDLRFTLLDGNGKKARFVRQAVLELELDNVDVIHCRLQAYRPGPKFVTIVARAVAGLSELVRGCAHLVTADARLLALKGRLPRQEIAVLADSTGPVTAAIGVPPKTSIAVHVLQVPLLDGERHLVEIPLHANSHG